MTNVLVTKEDKALFDQQHKETLAGWWCLLNSWKWPEMLSDEPKDEVRKDFNNRGSQLMREIEKRTTHRMRSWAWNKERMTREEFEDFFSGTFEGNEAAKERHFQRRKKEFPGLVRGE